MKLMNKLGRMLMVTAVLAGVTAGGPTTRLMPPRIICEKEFPHSRR